MTDETKYYDSGVDVKEKTEQWSCGCGIPCGCDSRTESRYGVNHGETPFGSEISEEELQEIYHDAMLGKVSVEILRPLSQDRAYKDLLTKQYDGYDKISRKAEDCAVKCGIELKDPTGFSRGMMYCTTMMNTMKDKSSSKLAEIMIQGINMGIISLTKIGNKLRCEGKNNELVNEMSDLLEDYLEQNKQFL